MDVTTSIREDDGKTQVTVTLTPEEVQEHINAFFKDLRKARIPGFRPGKAPRKVLEQQFGGHDAVFDEIATDLINDVAPDAVDGADVLFITDPEFEDAEPLVEGEPFTFTLYGKVKPEVELLSYDPVEIKMPPEEATEAEINAQLESLRNYYYSFETLEDAAAEQGNYVMAEITCTKENETHVQGLNKSSRLIELGGGTMPPEFEEQLIGAKGGETKEFEFTVADQETYATFGEGTIKAEVEVKEVREKVVPELDEAFCEKVGVESIDELRKQLEDAINQQKKEQLPDLKERRCVEELTRRVHGEVPQSYINFSREDLLRDFFGQLQRQNTSLDQFLIQNNISSEQFKEDVEEEAKEIAEQSLALDALFREKGWELTDEDIDKEFQVVENPEETRKQWEESGRMAVLREACRRSKATQWLVETAIVQIEDDADEDAE